MARILQAQPVMSKTNKAEEVCGKECDTQRTPGPTREGGGTTGAGNLSPGSANRTGGATSGTVGPKDAPLPDARKLPADA